MAWTLVDNFKGHRNYLGMLGRKGAAHPVWKGGTIIDKDGYIRTWAPNHPWPRKGYLHEHIRLMELSIGRRIMKFECVHHKNHNRQDNALKNLELMRRTKHSHYHRTLDAHSFRRDKGGRYVALSSDSR